MKGLTRSFSLVLIGLLAVAASVVLLGKADFLLYNPFSPEYEWDYPTMMASDDSGAGAIVDGRGQRLVFLDRQGSVCGIVRMGHRKDSFLRISSLTMASNVVYVADCQTEGGGKYANSCRIVRFSSRGEYLGTVYEETFPTPMLIARAMANLTWHQGRLYAVVVRDERLKVVEIAEGRMKDVRSVPFDWKCVRGAWYVPGRKLLVVTTFSREVWLYEGDGEGVRVDGGKTLVQQLDVGPDGTCVIYDRIAGRLLELGADREVKELMRGEIRFFRRFGDRMLVVGFYAKSLQSVDVRTGQKELRVASPYALKVLRNSRLAWSSLAVCALAVILAIVLPVIRRLRRCKNSAEDLPVAERPLGMLSLYRGNLLVVGLVFAIVTATLTAAHYRDERKNMESIQRRTARSLYELSPAILGDAIKRMDSAGACDGPDYDFVRKVIALIGDSAKDVDGDMDFLVLRFRHDGEPYCLLSILPWSSSFGDKLTEGEKNALFGDGIGEAVRRGKIGYSKTGGVAVSAVPLRDSSGELLGVAFLHRNSRNLEDVIVSRLVEGSIDLFAQLLVLVMLLGECKLLNDFLKLRREQIRRHGPKRTRCEAQRTIRVIQNIIPALFLAFLPTMARERALASGLTGGLFCTLPLVVSYGGDFLFRFILFERTQRAVRLSYQIGCAFCAIGCGILVVFTAHGGYWTLIASMALTSLGTALVGCCNTALRASGLMPNHEHRLLVFTNMEPAVGGGIGVALGAFLYDKLGLSSVCSCGVLLSVCMWLVVRTFVHSDVDRQPCKNETDSASWADILRFVAQPAVLATVVCMVFPITVLGSFQTYVLPVFNDEQGNSVVLVGFALMVVQVVSLFVLVPALKLVDRLGNRLSLAASMVLTLLTLLLYACMPDMRTMLILIFGNNLFVTIVATCAERLNIGLAESARVPYASVARYLVIGEGVAFALGAPIFSCLLSGGYAALGFSLFFALLVLLAVFLLVEWFVAKRQTGTNLTKS